MLRAIPMLLAALLLPGAGTLAAQAGTPLPSPSPTLPSDTLEANHAPRSVPGPMPELAPTLPSDTLQATQPIDSFPCNPFGGDSVDSVPADTLEAADPCGSLPTDPFGDDRTAPQTPGDSAALRDLRSWIERHPGLISPPPVRAVLVRV